MQNSESVINAYEDRTMATASLRTLSPKSKAYRSTSTLSSWKIASTVTEIQRKITLNTEQEKSTEDYFKHDREGSGPLPATGKRAALTWVRRRYDGPEEETVSEVKISAKLAHGFHEPHKPVHDQPKQIKDGRTGARQDERPHQLRHCPSLCETHPMMKQEVSVPMKA